MVGVPGRSKGCSTCRKRKKGCDKKRPICTQCSSAGLECGGYERKTVFLNRTQGTEANAVPVIYRRTESTGTMRTLGGVTDVVLSHRLAQTARVEQYISVFLSKYLPTSRLPAAGPGYDHSSSDWIEVAHVLYPSSKAIQLSLLSLGLFAAGESRYALQAYSRALRQLQMAVRIPSQTQSDSTLATCKILSVFEMFYGAEDDQLLQGSKWHSHLAGQLAIIQARSPYAYQSGVSHQLFADGRYPLIFSAIKDRRRFPLNTPEWRTIPWEKEPKSFKDKLVDILADLSEILADTDEMRRCRDPSQKTKLRGEVIRACQWVEECLRNWHEEVGPLTDFHDGNAILVDLTIPSDFSRAHTTLLYWTSYVILFSTLASIHDPSLSSIPPAISAMPYLRKVANLIPYFWSPDVGMRGANAAALPLGLCLHVAYATPHRGLGETALLTEVVKKQTVRDTVLSFLQSLQRDTAGPGMASLDGLDGLVLRAQSWMMGNCS